VFCEHRYRTKSDDIPVQAGCFIMLKVGSRLRCPENSLYNYQENFFKLHNWLAQSRMIFGLSEYDLMKYYMTVHIDGLQY
jgi:hypothetical protein